MFAINPFMFLIMDRAMYVLLFFSLVTVFSSCRTDRKLVDDKEEIVMFAKKIPVFSKGNVTDWINSHFKYPESAQRNKLESKVFVRFVVDAKGKVKNPEIIRTSGDKALDLETLRVISKMPSWQPAENDGKKVGMFYTLPVNFSLRK